ncbi:MULTISPECIES: hypothetical protein [Hyphomicrobiales]|uniref:hypothetical protein n=1 Tax=Hyphomicrobiales TaxID=356 RepID=UPI0012FA82C7|nr:MULTISPECIES: hypothetical protein [Phyllobacteriaceae]MCX8568969.1 hypothetical protein [Aminobacter sp. MET-1]
MTSVFIKIAADVALPLRGVIRQHPSDDVCKAKASTIAFGMNESSATAIQRDSIDE